MVGGASTALVPRWKVAGNGGRVLCRAATEGLARRLRRDQEVGEVGQAGEQVGALRRDELDADVGVARVSVSAGQTRRVESHDATMTCPCGHVRRAAT